MAFSKRKDEKICATCKYWMGNTKLSSTKSYVEVYEERSKCGHTMRNHGTTTATLKIGSGCHEWEQKYK